MNFKLKMYIAFILAMIFSGKAAAEIVTSTLMLPDVAGMIKQPMQELYALLKAVTAVGILVFFWRVVNSMWRKWVEVPYGLSMSDAVALIIPPVPKWIQRGLLVICLAIVLLAIFSASARAENATVVYDPITPIIEHFSQMFSVAWDIFLTVLKWVLGVSIIGIIIIVVLKKLIEALVGKKSTPLLQHAKEPHEIKKARRDAAKYSTGLYYLEPSLITPIEIRFYKPLCKAIMEGFTVHAKVRMEDVIGVHGGRYTKGRMRARGRVKSCHFDFVVTTNEGEIVCAIELDDSSHDRPDRQRADEIKNELAAAVGLKLLRFESDRDYSPEFIASQIAEN